MQHHRWHLYIDASLIGLAGVRGDLGHRAWAIRARILQWTGLPCGIGLGATKTLAKTAERNRRYGAGTVHVARTPDRHAASGWAALAPIHHALERSAGSADLRSRRIPTPPAPGGHHH